MRARSAKQAYYFANNNIRVEDRDDGLGVYWERGRDAGPPPLGSDQTEHWALIATCRAVTISLWLTKEEAEQARQMIDETGCGGECCREHEIVRMTRDEAARRRPEWIMDRTSDAEFFVV